MIVGNARFFGEDEFRRRCKGGEMNRCIRGNDQDHGARRGQFPLKKYRSQLGFRRLMLWSLGDTMCQCSLLTRFWRNIIEYDTCLVSL